MAELADWTCEYRGLVCGLPDSAISIVGVDGLLSLPDVRTADLTLVQRHGLWPGRDYLNGRTVTLTLEVYGQTREEFTAALSAIQSAFAPAVDEFDEHAFRFCFPGAAADRTAYVMARVRKRSAPLDLNFAYLTANVVIELFSTSPYMFGDSPNSATVRSFQRDAQPSGFIPPATVPWQITRQGSAVVDPVTRFTMHSSATAYPTVEIKNAAHPLLLDDVTGLFFSVAADDDMFIDPVAETVFSSTGRDLTTLVTVGSTWPELRHGEHRLRLRSRDEYTAATAVLTWRDRWI
ncbi:hypothetical protein ACFYOA_08185 [Streptomyces iakyrus]|uniref:hypothetical protein n=1 Tax=Streptomyces iakyrus TaxID=68219 RepID=UPI0036B1C157